MIRSGGARKSEIKSQTMYVEAIGGMFSDAGSIPAASTILKKTTRLSGTTLGGDGFSISPLEVL